jgi:vacuolar-type H+-ATPase subunit H
MPGGSMTPARPARASWRGAARARGFTPATAKAMKTADLPDELTALAELRQHEIELDQRLEAARLEAARAVAEARQAAERTKEDARAELLEELARLRRQGAVELELELAAIREEGERRRGAIRRSAERNREQALALVLARVTGRDTS